MLYPGHPFLGNRCHGLKLLPIFIIYLFFSKPAVLQNLALLYPRLSLNKQSKNQTRLWNQRTRVYPFPVVPASNQLLTPPPLLQLSFSGYLSCHNCCCPSQSKLSRCFLSNTIFFSCQIKKKVGPHKQISRSVMLAFSVSHYSFLKVCRVGYIIDSYATGVIPFCKRYR